MQSRWYSLNRQRGQSDRDTEKKRRREIKVCQSKCSSSILACWTSSGNQKLNCVTGSVEHSQIKMGCSILWRFQMHTCTNISSCTWFQRHHVVVTLCDAPDGGRPSQAAQARLTRPAAVRLHQAVQRSVEPAQHKDHVCQYRTQVVA